MTDIYAELERLKRENEKLRKAIKKHGATKRRYDIPEDILRKLFGYKVEEYELKPTEETLIIRTNSNTFISNLMRAVVPYPRYNKTNGWISNKPLEVMTDNEYKVCKKLVKDVMKLLYDAKLKLEQEDIK